MTLTENAQAEVDKVIWMFKHGWGIRKIAHNLNWKKRKVYKRIIERFKEGGDTNG